MNKVLITGFLNTKNPIEPRFTQSGTAVISFSVAVSNYKKQGEKQTYTYLNCVTFGPQAEFISNNQDRIKRVSIVGRIQTRSYDAKDGTKKYVTEIATENIEVEEWQNEKQNIQDVNFGVPVQTDDEDYKNEVTPIDTGDIPF